MIQRKSSVRAGIYNISCCECYSIIMTEHMHTQTHILNFLVVRKRVIYRYHHRHHHLCNATPLNVLSGLGCNQSNTHTHIIRVQHRPHIIHITHMIVRVVTTMKTILHSGIYRHETTKFIRISI